MEFAGKLTVPARDARLWLKGLQPLRQDDLAAWLKAMPDADLKANTHFDVLPLAQMFQRLIEDVGEGNLDEAREVIANSHSVLDGIERQIAREESQDGAR